MLALDMHVGIIFKELIKYVQKCMTVDMKTTDADTIMN